MQEDQYIRDILIKIEAADPNAFSRLATEHPICFHEKKEIGYFL